MTKRLYYSLAKQENVAEIDIYGDITSWPWEMFGEMSAHNLSKQLREMDDVDQINVHIASYGGEVKEGVAIYSALRNHKAKVVTYCDSMACSIASVIFMAGDERVMSHAGELMIHNAWTSASGNAAELRKQAEDIEKINDMSVQAYMSRVNIEEDDLRALMDAETWITAREAVDMGFATRIETFDKDDGPSQSVRQSVMEAISKAFPHASEVLAARQAGEDPDDDDPEDPDGVDPDEGDADGDDHEDPDGEGEDPKEPEENKTKQQTLRMTERFLSAIAK